MEFNRKHQEAMKEFKFKIKPDIETLNKLYREQEVCIIVRERKPAEVRLNWSRSALRLKNAIENNISHIKELVWLKYGLINNK